MSTKYKLSAVVLVTDKSRKELILGKFDSSYPNVNYRERVKLIGGNRCDYDQTAQGILERELKEELSQISRIEEKDHDLEKIIGKPDPLKATLKRFANEKEIIRFREEIINNLNHHGDYIFRVSAGLRKPYTAVASVYIAEVDSSFLEMVKENEIRGLSMTNEGSITVIKADNLSQGNPLTAHGAGVIIEDILQIPIVLKEPVFLRKLRIPTIKDLDVYDADKYISNQLEIFSQKVD